MEYLLNGFAQALTPTNLLACFLGSFFGTVVGVLPGLGPMATMALLLPFTFSMGPTAGLIMLAGIWYGAQYGGSTTSILLNMPGEAASVVTCIDGHQMAKKGRGGAALAIAAIGSFLAGSIGVVVLQIAAPPLARIAVDFGPPEYFAIAVLGLAILSNLTGRSPIKAALMVFAGLLIATVGMDVITSYPRFTFDYMDLSLGLDFVPVVMGLFGLAELISSCDEKEVKATVKTRFRDLYPNREEIRRTLPAAFRGGILGFVVGLIPGPAAVLSTFLSYMVERKLSKHPEEFGHGAVEGVAGPESANNSATAGALVPLLALGIPFAPPTAMLLAGLTLHGIDPGPLLMRDHPDIFWTFIASMYIGNAMLLVLNLPLVGLWASILKVPRAYLFPIVLVICLIGSYSVSNSYFEVAVMLAFGGIGYVMRKLHLDAAPLILGLVLGRLMEKTLRQSLIIFHNDYGAFLSRPIAITLLAITVVVIFILPLVKTIGKRTVASLETENVS